MYVESKGLHAQNCVCRNLACLCTVMRNLWDFLRSIVLQNIETNEERPFDGIQKTSKKVALCRKKIRVKNTKGGILYFRGTGRRCFCFRVGFGRP